MTSRIRPKKQILVVDDEVSLTQMLTMLLETRGYNVKVAYTATEALKRVSPECDLILLDLVLPDGNGFDVCRKLKQRKGTKNIPIIMLSAHSLYEDKVEGLYLGADDFLSKPCENEELFARIEAVIRRGKKNASDKPETQQEEVICELRRILDEGSVIPFYQPIYLINPFRLYGIEILTHPSSVGDLEKPEEFFKAALQFGLYTELEILSWSIALSRPFNYMRDVKIFLNCNPYFIESSQFARVRALFEKNNVPTYNVVLEITERSAITDFKLFYEQLQKYRDYGFKFAVDDVGGGYASLESIVETQPEVVKIDHHIVRDISNDSYKRSIIKFVVAFCKENGILCVAEGVETLEDFNMVRDLGVDAAQGYFLCRPTQKIDYDELSRKNPQIEP